MAKVFRVTFGITEGNREEVQDAYLQAIKALHLMTTGSLSPEGSIMCVMREQDGEDATDADRDAVASYLLTAPGMINPEVEALVDEDDFEWGDERVEELLEEVLEQIEEEDM